MKRGGFRLLFVFFIFLLSIISFTQYLNLQTSKVSAKSYPDFARLEINLSDATISEIHDGSKYEKYQGNSVTVAFDDYSLEFENVEIKGRGNTSWSVQKKPYQLTFQNKINLFSLGPSKKWILLANHFDETNLKNDLAFYIADELGLASSSPGEYVELYIDGDYRGLYYLTHKVKIGSSELNLKDPLGVLVEIENYQRNKEDDYSWQSENGSSFILADNVSEGDNELTNLAIEDFSLAFNDFEKALSERNFSKISEIIDIDSFVSYFLLSEFTMNIDAYTASFYMYKDGVTDKIHAGPAWDFDVTFYDRGWDFDAENYSNSELYQNLSEQNIISTFYYELMEIPEFRNLVAESYKEKLEPLQEKILQRLDERANYISAAANRDQMRWPDSYSSATEVKIKELKEWIQNRFLEFNEKLFNIQSANFQNTEI